MSDFWVWTKWFFICMTFLLGVYLLFNVYIMESKDDEM